MRTTFFILISIALFAVSHLTATSAGAGSGTSETDSVASAMDMCPVCSTIFDNKEHIKGIVALVFGEVEAIDTGHLEYVCQHTICLDCFNRLKTSDKPHCPQKRCPAPWGALSIGGLPPKTPFFIPLYSVNNNGDPLLIAALKAGRGHAAFQLLLNAGVDTNQQDALGRTALHLLVLEMKKTIPTRPPFSNNPGP